jgi:hypothetical protein
MKIVPFKNDFDWWSFCHFGAGVLIYWFLTKVSQQSGIDYFTTWGKIVITALCGIIYEFVWDNLLAGSVPYSDTRGISIMDMIFVMLGGICGIIIF